MSDFEGGNGKKGMGTLPKSLTCPGNGPRRNETWQTHGRSLLPEGVNGWYRSLHNSGPRAYGDGGGKRDAALRAGVAARPATPPTPPSTPEDPALRLPSQSLHPGHPREEARRARGTGDDADPPGCAIEGTAEQGSAQALLSQGGTRGGVRDMGAVWEKDPRTRS